MDSVIGTALEPRPSVRSKQIQAETEERRMSRIQVDANACVRCGACVDVCSIAKVYELEDESAAVVRPERCWGCGQCIAVCPTDAIDHEAFPLEECPLTESVELPSLENLTSAFRARRSCRTYRPQAVPREIVREAVTCARWVPTAENRQSFDWVAIDDRGRIADLSRETLAQIKRFARLAGSKIAYPILAASLGRQAARTARNSVASIEKLAKRADVGEDPIFYHAPVVLIGHGPAENAFARDDAIYAAYSLMLAAEQLGLATCQIGLFQIVVERSAAVRRLLPLPKGRKPQVAMSLGYRKHQYRRLIPRRTPDIVWNPR